MILTVDELREHVTSPLGDDALQRLLDAAEEAIVARAGAVGNVTEQVWGGYGFLSLLRPASVIVSISETVADTDTSLAVDDYALSPGGMVIERLNDGTNQRTTWGDRATVVYTPRDDDATREAVQIDLVKLSLTYQPGGVTAERIGEWSESFGGQSADWNIDDEREAILSRLDVQRGMIVLGGSPR